MVLLKYKESTFLFFSVLIIRLYFFLGSSLKAYVYWTSRVRSINEVYLKMEWNISNLLFSVKTGSKNWRASRTNLWYSSKLSGLLIFITPIIIVSKPRNTTSSSCLKGFHLLETYKFTFQNNCSP